MNDDDLDAAQARAKELNSVPIALMTKDQFFIVILDAAFIQLQKIARDLRDKQKT